MRSSSSLTLQTSSIRRFWDRHEYFSIGVLWAAIVAALFRDALLAGPDRVIGGNDVTYAYLPWLRFTVESVKSGIFPLWNPHVFGGAPFAGNPQAGLFYPATWLALWVGAERTFSLSLALHVWLAAMGMHGWMRQIGATRAGAFFASAAYALSGFVSARIWGGHYGPLLETALLPLLLWTATLALRRHSIAWAIVAAAPLGLMILAGHTPTLVLLLLGAGSFVVFEAIRAARSLTAQSGEGAERAKHAPPPARSAHSVARSVLTASGLLAVTLAGGAALAAIQIFPALTFVANSARVANISAEFASRFSLPPAQLLQMAIPDAFGEPALSGYWGAPVFEEYIYYVGVPTLILAFLSLFARDAHARFFVALGVFGLVVALGPAGGAYTTLHRFVPFFDLLRAPARAGTWTVLGFAAAAGLCLSALQAASAGEARRLLSKWPLWWIAATVVAGLIGAGAAHARFNSPSAPERFLAGDVLAFVALFVAASALIRLWRAQPARADRWAVLLGALLLIDLGGYFVNLVRMAPSRISAPYAAADRALGSRLRQDRLIWVYADLFQLNLGMDFGHYNVYGYDSLITARLQSMVDRARDLSSPIYDLLNVRYVISPSPLSEKIDRVGEGDGFLFYERPGAAPRAWTVHAVETVADESEALDRIAADFDAQSTAVVVGNAPCAVEQPGRAGRALVTRYEPNRIDAQVDAAAAGLLVFSEIDYPGWSASIDGAPAEIRRVNYGLRGVCVPAGSHAVSMIYDPPELRAGATVSLAAAAVIAGAGVVSVGKKRGAHRRARPPASDG